MTERSFSLEFHGWGASLSHWYARSADVLNRGAGGYNSRWLKQYLPRLLGNDEPDVAVLFIGNNDAIHESEPQHVPLKEYKENIISILAQLHDVKPSMVVLLVTTTRVNEQLKPLQKNQRRAQYAEVLRYIHRNRNRPDILGTVRIPHNIALVDLWGDAGCGDDLELGRHLEKFSIFPQDLHDGSHLNSTGNKKMYAALKDVINSQFPHLSPDHIRPTVHPPILKRGSSSGSGCGSSGGNSNFKTSVSVSANSGDNKRGPAERLQQPLDSQKRLKVEVEPAQGYHPNIGHGKENAAGAGAGAAPPDKGNSDYCEIEDLSQCQENRASLHSLHQPQGKVGDSSGHSSGSSGSSSSIRNRDMHGSQQRDQPLQWTVPRWRALV